MIALAELVRAAEVAGDALLAASKGNGSAGRPRRLIRQRQAEAVLQAVAAAKPLIGRRRRALSPTSCALRALVDAVEAHDRVANEASMETRAGLRHAVYQAWKRGQAVLAWADPIEVGLAELTGRVLEDEGSTTVSRADLEELGLLRLPEPESGAVLP